MTMEEEIIVIGATGEEAESVQQILMQLPAEFPIPIVVIIHGDSDSHKMLGARLREHCLLPVAEPEDKERILPGRIYLAPVDYHLLVEPGRFCLSLEAPVHGARPSIDILFETAADACGPAVVGVLFNDENRDGADGLERIRERGGQAIAQPAMTASEIAMHLKHLEADERAVGERATGRRRS